MRIRAKWCTDYDGDDFNPFRGRGKFNEWFGKNVIRLLRDGLNLKKVRTGYEEWNLQSPEPFVLTFRGDNYYITVRSMKWDKIVQKRDYLTPQIVLDVYIQREKHTSTGVLESLFGKARQSTTALKLETFFDRELTIEFPYNYPDEFPRIYVEDNNIRGSHSRHVWGDGSLCLYSPGDWKPKVSNILSAVQLSFKWIVWNYEEFGGVPGG